MMPVTAIRPVNRRIDRGKSCRSCRRRRGIDLIDGLAVERAGLVHLHLQMEQKTAVERNEEIRDEEQTEQQAGGADRGGNHQQEAENQELAIIPIGALLEKFHQMKQNDEIPDRQNRG